MSSSHASKGGRRWRYYVSRAALTGRKQDAGSIVRVPASEIENRITRAVGTHLAVQAAIAIDDHHINHSVLGANQAIPQHEQTRRLRRDPARCHRQAIVDGDGLRPTVVGAVHDEADFRLDRAA